MALERLNFEGQKPEALIKRCFELQQKKAIWF